MNAERESVRERKKEGTNLHIFRRDKRRETESPCPDSSACCPCPPIFSFLFFRHQRRVCLSSPLCSPCSLLHVRCLLLASSHSCIQQLDDGQGEQKATQREGSSVRETANTDPQCIGQSSNGLLEHVNPRRSSLLVCRLVVH